MQAGIQQRVLIDVVLPRIDHQARVTRFLLDAALVVGFALLTAVFAQIAFKIPTTTVPITGQTFGVLVTGGALGSKRGGLSMLVYMLLGMLSLPVFAPSQGVLEKETIHFILPWAGNAGLVWAMSSGGYIVGFILAGYLVGLLAERGWDRRSTVPLAMLIGTVVIYTTGLAWLAAHIATDEGLYTYFNNIAPGNVLDHTLRGGLYPFIGGDALKLLLAAMVLPGAWAVVDWVKGRPSRE